MKHVEYASYAIKIPFSLTWLTSKVFSEFNVIFFPTAVKPVLTTTPKNR